MQKIIQKNKKERLLERMFSAESIPLTNLSIETRISKSTLATWKSKATQLVGKTIKLTTYMFSKSRQLSHKPKTLLV